MLGPVGSGAYPSGDGAEDGILATRLQAVVVDDEREKLLIHIGKGAANA